MSKCPACGYEGGEAICPTCQEPMGKTCDSCGEDESNCTCAEEEENGEA